MRIVLTDILAVYLVDFALVTAGANPGKGKIQDLRRLPSPPTTTLSRFRESQPAVEIRYPLVVNFWSDIRASVKNREKLFENPNALLNCPKKYSLAVVSDSPLEQAPKALAKGSGSSVYKLGERYVVKAITRYSYQGISALVTEQRVMRQMMDQPGGAAQYGIANIYELSPYPRVSEVCKMRMLVTDLLPGTSLEERVIHGTPPALGQQSIFKIAAGALEALEKFHNSGFAHGDVHSRNFMIHESAPGDFSVRLIDLGHANPFADEFGSHITEMFMKFPEAQSDPPNITFMSPWHIESNLGTQYRSSRRDDVFRLAEMLLRISSGEFREAIHRVSERAKPWGLRLSLAEFKRSAAGKSVSRDIHAAIKEFYDDTLRLGFDEEPGYARWIAEFNRLGLVGVPHHSVVGGDLSSMPSALYPVVKNFYSDVQASEAAKLALISEFERGMDFSQCPTEYSLLVEGFDSAPLRRTTMTPFASGSGSSFFKLGEKYLIKLITGDPTEIVDNFITERVVMRSMMAQPGGPAKYGIANMYELKPDPVVSEICQIRMLVTDLIPGTSLLDRVLSNTQPSLRERSLWKIAAGALEAVRKFHSSGFAHGDIHMGNFMVSQGSTTPRLIDLGRANPFADEYGTHIEQRAGDVGGPPVGSTLNILLLSPWHIESNLGMKYRSSRRDDIFRLAEMFFQMSSLDFMVDLTSFPKESPERFLEFKLEAANQRRFKRPFRHFYRYSLGLRFDEEPDYEKWITVFTDAAITS
jgi:serine/threonine protein kinase